MRFTRIHVILLAALCLSGCSPEIRTSPPLPTPEIWQVQLTPALEWLGATFQACAAQQPGAHLVVSQQSAQALDPSKALFSFQMGQRLSAPAFAAVLGQEGMVVVVNPSNPVTQLSVDQLKSLFNGKTESWSQLGQTPCPTCTANAAQAVKAYVYAAGEDAQQGVDRFVGSADAILAPDPAAVRQAVAREDGAIGFLPKHWLDGSVKAVTLTGVDPAQLSLPILAMAPAEPQGAQRAWLLCVQQKLQ
jgi:hypothetical protein